MNEIITGNCVDVMKTLGNNTVDCVVTDPPYGMNFMGKAWDKALPPKQAFIEMCRVLKPGALAFVMSSPRQDLMWRMAQLLEESGFELGQSFISWVYASGFPKAYDVSKGIDAKKGLKQEVVGRKITGGIGRPTTTGQKASSSNPNHSVNQIEIDVTSPASSEAKQWSGWKSVTGLKPALEVIFMVQKPMSEKTIVDNVLKWGTGAVNVDACRIPIDPSIDVVDKTTNRNPKSGSVFNTESCGFDNTQNTQAGVTSQGRFPANLLVSDDALNDGCVHKSGLIEPHHNIGNKDGKLYNYGIFGDRKGQPSLSYGDAGSFSRYFDLDAWAKHHGILQVPKASTGEREKGLTGEKNIPKSKFNLNNGEKDERFDGGKLNPRVNTHPTVKPIKLMAYLIELGCPKNGVVLDPFVGSGTTCIAAKTLNRQYIGIELNEEYANMARERLKFYGSQTSLDGCLG